MDSKQPEIILNVPVPYKTNAAIFSGVCFVISGAIIPPMSGRPRFCVIAIDARWRAMLAGIAFPIRRR